MKTCLRSVIITFILLLLWYAVIVCWQLPDYILPTPYQVLITLYEQSSIIAEQAVPTLIETVLGFSLGILFGCIAGCMIAFYKPLGSWFLPILILSQAIPTFAIAPLLVIWLGYGIAAKIVTTIIMIFFPVTSALYDGLRSTNPGWIDLAKTMNASKWRLFFHIRLPAALPSLSSGIRIAAVIAPIGAIIGEWVGSSRGLGYLMLNANARLQIDVMFAALIVIILFTLGLYFFVDKFLRLAISWHQN